jgi:diaminopimelate decarboxylase
MLRTKVQWCHTVTYSLSEKRRLYIGKGLGFYTGDDGYLYCDGLRVEDCRKQHLDALAAAGLPQQPMYLYSKSKLTANYTSYKEAMESLPYIIGYAVKANNNLRIMQHLQNLGSGAVLVSGNELKLAQSAGFDTTKCAAF